VLEAIGPELVGGLVAADFLDQRRLYSWQPPAPLRTADLASRRAVGFGVSNELSSMTPYDVPQQWAEALDGKFEGITYRTRFDTGPVARGVAHFGPAGFAERPSGRGRVIGEELRRRLLAECSVAVLAPPLADELDGV
jgi:hypothetical protein